MIQLLTGIYNGYLQRKWDKKIRGQFGGSVKVPRSVLISDKTFLGGYNVIGENCNIIDSQLGSFTYVGENSKLYNCKIGKYCSISWNVEVLAGNHPLSYVSTHPVFYSGKSFGGVCYGKTDYCEQSYADENSYLNIGNDVLINAHAKIAAGVTIGNGAVIKSGAVVVKDVPAYAIVGGVPAKVIAYRFPDEDIKFLQDLKWWDKDVEWLKSNSRYFQNLELLKNHI